MLEFELELEYLRFKIGEYQSIKTMTQEKSIETQIEEVVKQQKVHSVRLTTKRQCHWEILPCL